MNINKVFIINLERDKARKARVEIELARENIQNYEFVKAVDGQNGELENYSFNVIPDWVEPFTSKVMTKGEIGCALSHYNIWEKIVQEKLEYALILEDDIILSENFREKLDEDFKSIENSNIDFDLLYLGRRPLNAKDEIKINENIIKAKYSYGGHAYILTFKGAKTLLETNYINNLFPVDEFLPLLYDDNYPLKNFLKYFQNKPQFKAYSVATLLVNIVFGEQYKSTTYNSDPHIISDNKEDYLVLSVGTDNNDALDRFEKSCKTYGHPYKILGLNSVWKGGDMAKGPGGGQKINLLKNELLSWSNEELNKIIMFTDSYDVVITSNKNEIFEKYNKLTSNNDNCVVFSAEISCWPNADLANSYPNSPTKMKYLNSGGFIGKASNVLKILETEVKDYEDDQGYYTMKFLNQTNGIKIILDYYCEIFQTLNGCTQDLDIVFTKSRVKNKIFGTSPCVIHGNGPEKIKLYLSSISNYLCDGWNSTYKFCLNTEIKKEPKIYICYGGDRNNLSSLLDYPAEQYIIKNMALTNVVEDFLKTDAEYLFVIENKYRITNPNTLKELLNINKNIVGPMFRKDGETWSNFWGELDNNGFYKRSFDYFDIIDYKRKAIWNIPYLTGVYLIKRGFLENNRNVYIDNPNMDLDMRFCKNVRKTNTFMYVTNMDKYGDIDDNEINIYDCDHKNWESKYIHPDYIKNIHNLSSICEEPCKDVFCFPIFTKLFCDEIMQYCNDLNEWSDGKNDKIDPRINAYENFPTQDIHLNQIKFETQWEKIVFKYIAPMASKMYSFYKTKNINISFVVKYSMDGQKKLIEHHDASTYTINICLNDAFEGGGCRFVRQNYTFNNKNIGYASMHPGKLTHYHEGLQITNGKRFILVSFIN